MFFKRCRLLNLNKTNEFLKMAGKVYNPLNVTEQPSQDSEDEYPQDDLNIFN